MTFRFETLTIPNPKRHADSSEERRLFPYYAGYSAEFTTEILKSAGLESDATVLDPWSGAGTTIQAANKLGYKTVGIDLNPVMVIVAKAGLLSPLEEPSLLPLAESIVSQRIDSMPEHSLDPLSIWLVEDAARAVRSLENAINKTLVLGTAYLPLSTSDSLRQVSPLAAFFYVALFRTVRRLLADFVPTNPTWVKMPKDARQKKRPRTEAVNRAFVAEVKALAEVLPPSISVINREETPAAVVLGSSQAIPLSDNCADFVLSSPPYCTRIDYAVATALELAVLRYDDKAFDALRRSLMGTSTVESHGWASLSAWGNTCAEFLQRLYEHPSKASKTYYYKSHLQYFDSLYRSVSELRRILRPGGACVLVVQDSHYKDIHNDVPKILTEMAGSAGLLFRGQKDFIAQRSMVRMNKRAKKYLSKRIHVESVVCLEKA